MEDRDLVAIHSRMRLKPEGRGIALVHIFRFRDDVMVELWDLGESAPEDSPNKHGMF